MKRKILDIRGNEEEVEAIRCILFTLEQKMSIKLFAEFVTPIPQRSVYSTNSRLRSSAKEAAADVP